MASEYKFQARIALKKAQELRAKISKLLREGSDNFTSETPLFDGIEEEGDDNKEKDAE